MEIDGRRDFSDSTKKDIHRNRDTFQVDIFQPYQARFHSVFSLVFHAMNLSSKHLMFSIKIHNNVHFFIPFHFWLLYWCAKNSTQHRSTQGTCNHEVFFLMTSVSYIAPCKSNVAGLLRVKDVTATCPKLRFTTLITKGSSEEICTSYILYQHL
jgi:hypothetical protein